MIEELQALVNMEVQIATALETICGTIVSVDGSAVTLRTSEVFGYESGSYAIIQLRFISYIRLL
ncbi:hypothetical protein [Paenibacillus glycanilyticus]|uniref:DUF2642 domain-containing protein n=1 Tax=Paenibacillus glycanilyticus TaxID=126569 RepID=A0ABQ6GK54_9BACL|nr:hypothetical protein [Paenibacillus glycanilyticus]GLX70613.1 hypothetical protein MU1_49590 [Paenibacillus glycanilyticus]